MAKAVTSSRQRAVLSRERIVAAAVSLIDTEGLDALSMRRLGHALDVEAMSLYRHFPSKGALLEAVVARLLAELPVPAPTAARWQDAFRAVARAYRALRARSIQAELFTLQASASFGLSLGLSGWPVPPRRPLAPKASALLTAPHPADRQFSHEACSPLRRIGASTGRTPPPRPIVA